MSWEPAGQLFVPGPESPWIVSHAALPVAVKRADGSHRVFFCGRDGQSRSRIGYFDADLARGEVLAVSTAPVLGLGELGAFDDAGVTSSCVVEADGRLVLYYSGWSVGVSVPFYFFVGAAQSTDGGESFVRLSRAPVLERSDVDPFLTASPAVLREGDRWRMWYVACSHWAMVDGAPRHYYHVRHATSEDGLHWDRNGQAVLDFAGPSEYAMGRPCVVREDGRYKMWLCARGDAYRLAYAESLDGLAWTRLDETPTARVAAGSWDEDMQAYPWYVRDGEARYLLYNGNGYGFTGIGLARWRH